MPSWQETITDLIGSSAMKIAKERKSSVLSSNAVHHRIDSLTSIVALTAIVGSHILHNVSWLDPVGGLLVSTMVIKAGWGNTGVALLELSDVGVSADFRDAVRKAADGALNKGSFGSSRIVGSEVEVQDIQGVKAGQNYLMNIELAVPGEWSVKETRTIEDAVRERVGSKVRGVRRLRVRFVAKAAHTPNFADEFITADVSPRSSPEPDERENGHVHPQIHDHRHNSATKKATNRVLRKGE